MAWLEKRRGIFHVNFFHGDRHYSRSLKTRAERTATSLKLRLEDTLADIERGRLEVPADTDLMTFLLSEGKVMRKVVVPKALTLEEFFAKYQAENANGGKDENTRYTENIHINHLLRLLGEKTLVRSVTTEVLQGYVTRRSEEDGLHGRSDLYRARRPRGACCTTSGEANPRFGPSSRFNNRSPTATSAQKSTKHSGVRSS